MDLRKWLRIAFINILIVAALGVILRYKIAFSLPFLEQKKLLHGHSHFAFSGWVSQALMAIIVHRLSVHSGKELFKKYNWLLWANLICAYGMLVGFITQGYNLISILFSTCTLFVSYFFMYFVWQDIKHLRRKTILSSWLKAATFFNAFSSIGAFTLAFMMATKNTHQNWYLGAVYFFLHFQYNGWFSFSVLGLITERLQEAHVSYRSLRSVYKLFVIACVPAYFLSALWMPIPTVVYVLVVAAAILQALAWLWLIHLGWQVKTAIFSGLPKLARAVIFLSLLAFSIKFTLQLGSTIPALSTIAFGFRPIVIGYLHLVLLGCISLFILGYAMYAGALVPAPSQKTGIMIFVSGIILNELALMVQGITAMGYISLPHINEILFGIALMIFSGLAIMNIRLKSAGKQTEYKPGALHALG